MRIWTQVIVVMVVPFVLAITTTQTLAEVNWEKTFGGSLGDRGSSVQQTLDGGYIIAGLTNLRGTSDEHDILLLKTDADGNELWSRTFGGSGWDGTGYGTGVQQTTDGGYIIGSATKSFGAGGWDIYLIKTDADGNEVWSKTFGDSRTEIGTSVQQTTDGGYIVAGEKWSGDYDVDFYLVKTNPDGDMEWEKTLGSTGWAQNDRGRAVRQTADGGFIMVGITQSFGAGGVDAYLIKTDAKGNELWSKTFGGSEHDNAESVQQTLDGGYILAGFSNSFGSDGDSYLIKTDSDGNEVWSKTLGYEDHDAANSVQQTLDGGYVITGYVSSSVYLFKTDAEGNEQWNKTFGGETEWSDRGNSVQQTRDGGYVVAGTKSLYSGEDDFYLIYYSGPEVPVNIKVHPKVLNLKSKGKKNISCIRLPKEYDPRDIASDSIELSIPSCPDCSVIISNCGFPLRKRFIAFFPRQDLIDEIKTMNIEIPAKLDLKVNGEFNDGKPFWGLDTIRVIKPKRGYLQE